MLTKDEYEEIVNAKDDISGVTIDMFTDKSDRTLMYGYTFDRETVHMYIQDGELVFWIYDINEKPVLVYRNHIPCSAISGIKRAYPHAYDREFLLMTIAFDCHPSDTTYNERIANRVLARKEKFIGEVY